MTMNAAVRGKSDQTRLTRRRRRRPRRRPRGSSCRRAARARSSGRAARGRGRGPRSRFGPNGRRDRERRQVALRRGAPARSRRTGPAGRPGSRTGAGTASRVSAGIDVDVARDARRPAGRPPGAATTRTARRRSSGVVAGPGRPDRDHERRELALAELAREDVVGLARRDPGREDRGVRGVEPDVEERQPEDEQQRRASARGPRPGGASPAGRGGPTARRSTGSAGDLAHGRSGRCACRRSRGSPAAA